jgi:hypothetical protein
LRKILKKRLRRTKEATNRRNKIMKKMKVGKKKERRWRILNA